MNFWKLFRIIFVFFSLYLTGDAFYRWDGFSYYASISEFIPSVALITILWTVIAGFFAFLIWMCGTVLEYVFHKKIKIEHFFCFIGVIVLSGALVFILKNLWPQLISASQIKFFLIVAIISSFFIIWLFRNMVKRWLDIIQDRITPLVWIFGALFLISIPVVTYQTWFSEINNRDSQYLYQPAGLKDKKNILLITFDALSARNMSLYGYERITTPFIDQWSKNASVFTNLHAESNSTRPTSESIMTGKRVWTHGTYGLENYYDKSSEVDIENIAYVLKKEGYYNVALTQNYLASPKRMGIAESFDEITHATQFYAGNSLFSRFEKNIYRLFGNKIILHDWILKKDFIAHYLLYKFLLRDMPASRNRTDLVFNKALDILNHDIPQPFFMWIHLYPPHDPYMPPESYVGMYDASLEMRTLRAQSSLVTKMYGRVQQRPEELRSLVLTLRARYDEFIRYCDDQFKNFIGLMESKESLRGTLLVLSADHGEIITQINVGHGRDLGEPETHIPLVIRENDQIKGKVISGLVEQIDIPATILDLVNIPVPLWMEGRSLKPFLRGENLTPRPSFSMQVVGNPSHGPVSKGQIAVWEGDYKLIHDLSIDNSRLFNLKSDPDELNNLFDKEPEIGQRLLKLIKENLDKANGRILNSG